jgi:ribonuclease BN (tRNA processing enzyme)
MSGYLLEIDGEKLLFDSGPGVLYQLLKVGINLNDIDHLFYSHLHIDHTADLPSLLWSFRYGTKRKNPLNLHGPPGFKSFCETLFSDILKIKEHFFEKNVFEHRNSELEISGIKIKTRELKHHGNVGYRIEHKGRIFVYSGDTAFCNEIIELAKEADLLLLECSFPNELASEHPDHLSPKECGEIATKANAKILVLTHFYPECEKYDIQRQTKRKFQGKIILAKDLMEIEV